MDANHLLAIDKAVQVLLLLPGMFSLLGVVPQ